MKLREYKKVKKALTQKGMESHYEYRFEGSFTQCKGDNGPIRNYVICLFPKNGVIFCLTDLFDTLRSVGVNNGVLLSVSREPQIRII